MILIKEATTAVHCLVEGGEVQMMVNDEWTDIDLDVSVADLMSAVSEHRVRHKPLPVGLIIMSRTDKDGFRFYEVKQSYHNAELTDKDWSGWTAHFATIPGEG